MPDMRKIGRSLFYEMSAASERDTSARLSAAGFNDITLDEVLVLGALEMSGGAAAPPGRKPDFSSAVPDKMADKLFLRGYLEKQINPHDPGRTITAVTSRGHLAVAAVMEGVFVDRWAAFPFRPGDIVISPPNKSGTTWMQMICALLIFQTPDLPASLHDLSPWVDQPIAIRDEVFERYAAQQHRRFIKSHRPLADIPIVPQVTYIAVGRNPLDVCVSDYYQGKNLSPWYRGRDGDEPKSADEQHGDTPREWLLKWIAAEPTSPVSPTSLLGILRHIADAWARRDAPNIVLMHYEDLSADLEGEMRSLATRLGITVSEELWPGLVKAATFEQMRAGAEQIQPLGDMLEDHVAFFHKGKSGSGAELLTAAELASYHARVAQILEPDVLAWLHRSG